MSIIMVIVITITLVTVGRRAWDPVLIQSNPRWEEIINRIEGEQNLPVRVNIRSDVSGRTLLAWSWLPVHP